MSIATVIGEAALQEGLYLKQAEVHGMSQRGGDVQSNLRLSSEPIMSDLIPKGGADLIISLEPMEALRYVEYLAPDGWIVTSEVPYLNIPNYPEIGEVLNRIKAYEHHVLLDVEALKSSQNQKEDMAKALKDLAEAEDSKMLFGAPEAQPVATGSPIGTIKTPARPMNTLDEIYKGNPYYHPSTSNV